jgi:hypothetical protein
MDYFTPGKKGSGFRFVYLLIPLVLVLLVVVYFAFIRELGNKGVDDSADIEKELMDEQLGSIPGANTVEKLARVGREYLFVKDLDYQDSLYLEPISETDREKAINMLVNNSVLLQVGLDMDWIELDSEFFNNPFKDYSLREEKVDLVRDMFEKEYIEGTSVEAIHVWFYNVRPGEYMQLYGEEAAEEKANEIIKSAYYNVKNKDKSMEEAANIIINESMQLPLLNPSYQTSTYVEYFLPYELNSIDDLRGEDFDFGFDGLYSFLQSASEGDLSKIYLEKDRPDGEQPVIDAYYAFYKLKSKRKGYTDIDAWISDKKSDILMELY